MRYTTLIFDLDGTLLDTLQDLYEATNYALTQNGMLPRTLEEVRLFVGNGIRRLIERAVPLGTPAAVQEQAFADFNIYYKEHCFDNTKPYPGVPELLEQARALGLRTGIVSNKADYAVQDLVLRYFPGLMDAACGEREGIARKPAPDMLLEIMGQLQADPAATVYIGDSDTDLLTAANTGVPCIGACWGCRGRDFLEAHGAKLLAECVEDILPLCR